MSKITTIYYKTKDEEAVDIHTVKSVYNRLTDIPSVIHYEITQSPPIVNAHAVHAHTVQSFDELSRAIDSWNMLTNNGTTDPDPEEVQKELQKAHEESMRKIHIKKERTLKILNGVFISIFIFCILTLFYGIFDGSNKYKIQQKNLYTTWIKLTGKSNITFEELCELKKNNLLNSEKLEKPEK